MRHTLILSNLILPVCAASVSFVLFACAVPTPTDREGSRGTSSSIIGGTPSSNADDDSVVLLAMPGTFCTGTLIAPNLVLTARHCVSEPGTQSECGPFGADKSPSTIGVALGEHPSSAAVVARGTKLFLETKSSVCGQDIALVLLDGAVAATAAKPKTLRLTAPVVGELTTAIGYGQDAAQQITGRQLRSGIPVQAIGPTARTASANGQTVTVNVPANDFMTGESVCHGDSGGPLFDAQGQIIGTTSRGTALGCVGAPALFSSTAGHVELIKTALAAAGHPLGATTTPDAGPAAPDASAPPNNGGTTAQPGGDPTAPSPGSKKEGGESPDDNVEDQTPSSKKDTASDEDNDDAPRPRRPATAYSEPAAAGACSASPASPRTSSGCALLIALVAAAFGVRRRRMK